MKRICIGFDGMCSDVSIFNIAPHFEDIRTKWPVLSPLMDKLENGRDEELTCEAKKIKESDFYTILNGLQGYDNTTTDIHIGANSALEVVTAANLLSDRVSPVAEAEIDYLGFWSRKTIDRVPETIPVEMLSNAQEIEDSEAVSLIMPHNGKRAILSFGGNPPIRSMSNEMRKYIKTKFADYLSTTTPDLLVLVGTATTWSSADEDDFNMLEETINAAQKKGVRVLFDLGGLGSWSSESLARYFSIIEKADILSMNETELELYYTEKNKKPSLGLNADQLAGMVKEVVNHDQGFLVHTPHFQLSLNLEGAVDTSLEFAGKTASLRAQIGKFPTVSEVVSARLPISEKGKEQVAKVPPEFKSQPGYTVKVKNAVGLGDTWTCSFILSYLGGEK